MTLEPLCCTDLLRLLRNRRKGPVVVRTIPHRELRNNSSAVLRDVSQGETIQITNHGEVVAILVPPSAQQRSTLRVRRARIRGGFAHLERVELDHPVQESLDELRGDR